MKTDPAELERLASLALRNLPQPRAPRTLLARVMVVARQEAERPWYRRAWRHWPAVWRATSAAAIVLVAAGGVLLIPGVFGAIRDAVPAVGIPLPSLVTGPVRTLAAVWDAMHVVWRLVVQPVAPYLAVFVLVMSMACVAFGTALDRVVALGGATKS